MNYPKEQIVDELNKTILSASGFRKEFGDGQLIKDTDSYLTMAAACSFARFLRSEVGNSAKLIISSDSRPSGPALQNLVYFVFSTLGLKVTSLPVCALPELSSIVRAGGYDGFFYISASHNPPADNGFKFGLSDGAVLAANKCKLVINYFKNLILNPSEEFLKLTGIYSKVTIKNLAIAHNSYQQTMLATLGNEQVVAAIKLSLARKPLGVVIDYNGSARINSIDREFLKDLGIKSVTINHQLGRFAHDIIPEGENLEPARKLLEREHQNDSDYLLGFCPDCDGDRGNLVYYDEAKQQAVTMGAQLVFALSVLSELAYLSYLNTEMTKVAVVANCATSLRINAICTAFGVKLFTTETGEANVVGKAAALREEGYTVRILGEGSNGGNITYPNVIRDPLSTLCSLIKLLAVPQLYQLWCTASGQSYEAHFTLADIIAGLPNYSTTSIASAENMLQVKSSPKLKAAYEEAFIAQWPQLQTIFTEFGYTVTNYQFINYEGQTERAGKGSRSGDESGGLRTIFYNEDIPLGFFWLRGSKTEPVMRIMVDIKDGNPALLSRLQSFLTGLIIG
ncbi:MAG: phosphatidylglycerol lysyltransferase [Spirochaetaceae bacterium]|nr:phosphatidylglycerol lysyltransferase [Spirochaetaceae bacterium]